MPRTNQQVLVLAAILVAAGNLNARPPKPNSQNPSRASHGRIIILAPAHSIPPAQMLAAALSLEFSQAGVFVEVEAREDRSLTLDPLEIERLAKQESQTELGLIALAGYSCDPKQCRILIEHPSSDSSCNIRMPVTSDHTAFFLAESLREALLGPLLSELDRLAHATKQAGPPQQPTRHSQTSLEEPMQARAEPKGSAIWPWLSTELGYQGAYFGGATSSLHGPALALTITPRSTFALALSASWLGLDRGKGVNGEVETHRLAMTLGARALFNRKSAVFAIAPILRLDSVYATFTPKVGPRSSPFDLELLGGLELLWFLSLPVENLSIVLGAGILGAIATKSYSINGETIVPRPGFSVTWCGGLSYGLPWPR